MSPLQRPSWYRPDNVRETVQAGLRNNVPRKTIATVLAEHEFEDIESERIISIINAIPAEKEDSITGPDLSQPASTNDKPRQRPSRQLAVADIEYLSNREAARLVGLSLEQFDGNTVRPPATAQVESDLVWHRQGMTVALRVIPLRSGVVDSGQISPLLDGSVVSEDTRSPSQVAVVTNRAYTDAALEYADENNILCYDAGHVEEWFRRARIPMQAVGTVLEDGENHDGPLTELVEIEPIPEPRQVDNPLEINRAFSVDALEETESDASGQPQPEPAAEDPGGGQSRTGGRNDPLAKSDSTPGETGTLYADPDEDGDYDAFDDFLDDI